MIADLYAKGKGRLSTWPILEIGGSCTTVLLHVSAGWVSCFQCIGPECVADGCRNEAAQGRVRGRQCSCSCRIGACDIGLVGRKYCVSNALVLVYLIFDLDRVARRRLSNVRTMAIQTQALLVIVLSQDLSM